MDEKNIEAVKGIIPTLYLNRERTYEFIQIRELTNPANNLLLHTLEIANLKGFQKNQIINRLTLLQNIKTMEPVNAIKLIRKVYDKYLEADERKNVTMHKEMVKETLAEIESSAARFKTISEFLAFVEEIIEKNKRMEELRKDPKADVVKLMTIHKSKGLEFPIVYLIGVSETFLLHASSLDIEERRDVILTSKGPDKIHSAIEAERRLVYVAVTRAEEELYISSPTEPRGQKVVTSRFILDVFTQPNVVKTNNNQQLNQRSTKNRKQPLLPKSTKRVVESSLVWECTTVTCYSWKRIASYEEMLNEQIPCSVCGGRMVKEVREIYSN
ncbi:UvrD/REP helicase [Neobacillus vireti LMG 21834]|uniref:UvrD/REP helicase n=2 Tax=Neobacillus TaxID=2675232 RepID=A0AB94IPM5_9BACI|nr:UvrD/REP helicase [Neobacillus vireti LMG 21834]